MRPRSIVQFERCYLGAWAIGVVNSAINWSRIQTTPQVRQAAETIGGWYLPTVTAVGLTIPLVLWYCVARRGSTIARGIVVVFAALGVVSALSTIFISSFPSSPAAVLGITALVLNLIAAWLLFRPDAGPWFGAAARA